MTNSTTAALDACPFCRRPMTATRAKLLYGHPVCSKCFYAFANRRQFAFVLDRAIWILPAFGLGVAASLLVTATGHTLTPEAVSAINLLSWPLYIVFLLKDGFQGYSPGKWLCGVQTIDRVTRQPTGFVASLKRNLPIYIPIVPLIIAYQLQNGKRWGDGWANTMVIWKKFENSYVFGAQGRCETCNYDLRGNASGVCPECGTPVSAANLQTLMPGTQYTAASTPVVPLPQVPPTPPYHP